MRTWHIHTKETVSRVHEGMAGDQGHAATLAEMDARVWGHAAMMSWPTQRSGPGAADNTAMRNQ